MQKKEKKKNENWKIISNTIYISGNIDIVCSHSRAVEYLADALRDNCGFPGVPVSK